MKLSSKCQIAIVCLLTMARSKSAVPLHELRKRHGYSISYLEQIFSKLKKAGIIRSEIGPVRGVHVLGVI